MLAAGGHGGRVHLWDARGSTSPVSALALPGKDAVTSIVADAVHGRCLVGTAQGRLHAWDLRKVQRGRPQVGFCRCECTSALWCVHTDCL